jgi:hypothetical protein
MSNADKVVECARVMHGQLSRPDLLGSNAPAVERRIDALLSRAGAGDDVSAELQAVFDEFPITREWAKRFLTPPPVVRGFKGTPGTPGPVSAGSRYVCPKCGRMWIRRQAGEAVPDCPVDLIPRVDVV